MNEGEQHALIEKICGLIERNELELPTLPDVAIKVRDLIDDPNVSGDKVIAALAGDPAIATQIIRAANSAAFADKPPIENVRGAVARLGYRQLRNIVLNVALSNLMHANSPTIKKHLEKFWQHSREVAAVSYVIALHQKHLNPDQGMLAGMIHDIGVIPLCLAIDHEAPTIDAQTLETLLHKSSATVGGKLLQAWNFQQNMLDVVMEHENLQRESRTASEPDYADVVAVANMQDRLTAKLAAWENITAAQRLGMTPADCQSFLERFAAQLAMAHDMLGIGEGKPSTPPKLQPVQSTPPRSQPKAEEVGGLSGVFKKFFG